MDDLGAQSGVYTRPCVVSRVRPWILAEGPNDELIRVRRSFKNIGVVTIKATLGFNDAYPAVWHLYLVIVSFTGAGILPLLDYLG